MTRILVGVSASAACFKAVAVCSALAQTDRQGTRLEVQAVLSKSATRLVTPLQFAAVTGRPALADEWQPQDPAGMDHIALARAADLFVLVPASADRIGLCALGLAPDLLGSLCLAWETNKTRMFVPAMNPEMWAQPAVQRNVAQLLKDGWQQLGPVGGATACGEEGVGRMLEPDAICEAVLQALA